MRKLTAIVITLVISALIISPALAIATIRIEPHGSYYGLPIMLTSPATFYVNLTAGESGNPTTDPHIFLVMTETSYNSLTGNVVVNWTEDSTPASLTITTWTMETLNSVKVPPGAESGTGYTVAALRDHLNTTEPIYWAFEPFLGDMDITHTPIPFTITVPATDPRVAVYVLGKTVGAELFDNRSPPTQPGFIVPEPATIAITAMSVISLIGYAVIKRRH